MATMSDNLHNMLGLHAKSSSHHKKSDDSDRAVLSQYFRKLRPFRLNAHRRFVTSFSSSVTSSIDKYKLHEFVARHCSRAIVGYQLDIPEDDP